MSRYSLEEVIGFAFTGNHDTTEQMLASLADVPGVHLDLELSPEEIGYYIKVKLHYLMEPTFKEEAVEPRNTSRILRAKQAQELGIKVEIPALEYDVPMKGFTREEFKEYAKAFRLQVFWEEPQSQAPFAGFAFPKPGLGYIVNQDSQNLSAYTADGMVKMIAHYQRAWGDCLVHNFAQAKPELLAILSSNARKILNYLKQRSQDVCEEKRLEEDRLKKQSRDLLAKEFGEQ